MVIFLSIQVQTSSLCSHARILLWDRILFTCPWSSNSAKTSGFYDAKSFSGLPSPSWLGHFERKGESLEHSPANRNSLEAPGPSLACAPTSDIPRTGEDEEVIYTMLSTSQLKSTVSWTTVNIYMCRAEKLPTKNITNSRGGGSISPMYQDCCEKQVPVGIAGPSWHQQYCEINEGAFEASFSITASALFFFFFPLSIPEANQLNSTTVKALTEAAFHLCFPLKALKFGLFYDKIKKASSESLSLLLTPLGCRKCHR